LVDQPLNVGDRARGIEILRARFGAIHYGVTTIQTERIFERVEPFARGIVATIDDPPVSRQQRRRAQVAI
jgi:hypothetical protein